MLTHSSAGGQLLHPSDVYSSIICDCDGPLLINVWAKTEVAARYRAAMQATAVLALLLMRIYPDF